ncbi:MAG: hypothetical protein ACLSEX_01110 [Blautia sp.]
MTFETDDSSDVEDSTASIQEMLDSLPTADELRDMTLRNSRQSMTGCKQLMTHT